jgi:hypothetical protein
MDGGLEIESLLNNSLPELLVDAFCCLSNSKAEGYENPKVAPDK